MEERTDVAASRDVGMETELEEEEHTEHQPVRSVVGPRQPTQAQIDDHEASGHAAYRSWC